MNSLAFFIALIVLFPLIIGLRNRIGRLERNVAELETNVDELQNTLQTLRRRDDLDRASKGEPEVAAPLPKQSAPTTPLPKSAVLMSEPLPSGTADSAPDLSRTPRPAVDQDPALPQQPPPIPSGRTSPRADEPFRDKPQPGAPAPVVPPEWLVAAKEWLFGGNLVAKAGLLILFFGVSFLLKYAAARVTVPIELRLAAIALADIGMLLWGWRIREKRPAISLPVQGGALGILMMVTFGAFRLYQLIPGGMAFGLLMALTFFTCVLAVLQNAVWLAVFGIIGGFAAPILTSTGQGSHIGLFSYYALLNAGILAISLKRSWRLLNLLGFAFTFLIGTAWGVLKYQPENYLSAQSFLILFFAFYVAIAILYASKQALQLKNYVDGVLVFGTPILAFGLQYGLVRQKPLGLAFSALALGLFYVTLALALWKRRGGPLKLLVESFLALGIIFGTVTIPFALDGRWTSAAWAIEGAGIVWVGLRQKQKLTWIFGVLVQVGAWISFVGSVAGLKPLVAAQSNLWLGFLILAGSGLGMAMNFRKHSSLSDEKASPALTLLATVFLAFASFWLLAGAWTEIFLHVHGPHIGTLFAGSGMMVAAILGLIAGRLKWGIARYFALVPQISAGLVFVGLALQMFGWRGWAAEGRLFSGPFLGAAMIALSAGFSSFVFQRQQTAAARKISHILLGWSAFWWFGFVLPSLAAWGEWMILALLSSKVNPNGLFHAFYNLLLAGGGVLFALLATRLKWPELRWPASAVWLGLLFSVLGILGSFYDITRHVPGFQTWAGLAILWAVSEWLLLRNRREGCWVSEHSRWGLRGIHLVRTVGPWLILWPLGRYLITLGLMPGTTQESALLASAEWFAPGSWARYIPAWAMMGVVALCIPPARENRWPTAPISNWYRDVLIPLGALWALTLVILWNLTQDGRMDPLPYLPILNPIDLTTGFAALLATAAGRMHHQFHPQTAFPKARILAGIGIFAWFNLMLLRTSAQYLKLPYQVDSLYRSQFIQAMLSLVWSLTALLLMRVAAKRLNRTPWLAGAVLLAAVVAKLFIVDLSNIGSIERIISFLGVGILMLAIGYLAPFPVASSSDSPKADQ